MIIINVKYNGLNYIQLIFIEENDFSQTKIS